MICKSIAIIINIIFIYYRKSESITFPDHLYKTLPNLIYFILEYSSTTLRLHTGLSICSQACITANIGSTVRRIHSLNHSLSKLVKLKHALQRKIQVYTDRLDARGSAKNMLKILQWYKDVLAKRISLKHLQLNEARHLHKVLLSTQGPFIEKHKLSTILTRYTAYSRRYAHLENDRLEDDLLSVDVEIDSSGVSHQSHDEL